MIHPTTDLEIPSLDVPQGSADLLTFWRFDSSSVYTPAGWWPWDGWMCWEPVAQFLPLSVWANQSASGSDRTICTLTLSWCPLLTLSYPTAALERDNNITPFHAHLGLVLSRHILVFVIQLNECCTILNLDDLPHLKAWFCLLKVHIADTMMFWQTLFIQSTLGVWTCDLSIANPCWHTGHLDVAASGGLLLCNYSIHLLQFFKGGLFWNWDR